MSKKAFHDGAVRSPHGYFVLIALLVAAATLYIWHKVELGELARRIDAARERGARLEEERSRLAVAVALEKKPARIRKLAEEKLGMTYPAEHLELLVEPVEHVETARP